MLMKMSEAELKEKAGQVGVRMSDIGDASLASDPKAALVEKIAAAEVAREAAATAARANTALKDAEAAEKTAVAAAAAAKTAGGAEAEAERGLIQQQLENIKPESLGVKLLDKENNPGSTLKERLEEITSGDAANTGAALKEQNKKLKRLLAEYPSTIFKNKFKFLVAKAVRDDVKKGTVWNPRTALYESAADSATNCVPLVQNHTPGTSFTPGPASSGMHFGL
jgi:hypothetical protein